MFEIKGTNFIVSILLNVICGFDQVCSREALQQSAIVVTLGNIGRYYKALFPCYKIFAEVILFS
jgi:hypothetical protein